MVSTEPQLATGVEGLDEILSGGLPERCLYLVQGDPGVGKTTLALQFVLAGVGRGERAVYVTLSETAGELARSARSHGWSLEGLEVVDLGATNGRVTTEAQQTIFHPVEVELQALVRRIFAVVEQARPRRVVIDSLSELRLIARDPLRYRRQILEMKRFFAERQVTTLLLDDRTGLGDEQLLQSLAHGVIFLEQFWPSFGDARRRLRVVKMRGLRYRGGAHDLTIETGGVAVYPRVVAAEHRAEVATEQVSSGVPALDTLLGGGIHRGTSTLLMGPSGTGKSILVTQLLVAAAARGERSVIFMFDESLSTLIGRSRGLGIDLGGHVRTGTIEARQVDPGELAPGQFIRYVTQAVDRGGARLVAIDSLNGYLNAALEERALHVQLHELFSYLGQQGVITLTTAAQHGLLGEELQPAVAVSYLADNVLLLRYFEAGGQVRKALSVMKQRRGRHEATIRELAFGEDGVRIGAPLVGFQGVLTGIPTFVGVKGALMGDADPPRA